MSFDCPFLSLSVLRPALAKKFTLSSLTNVGELCLCPFLSLSVLRPALAKKVHFPPLFRMVVENCVVGLLINRLVMTAGCHRGQASTAYVLSSPGWNSVSNCSKTRYLISLNNELMERSRMFTSDAREISCVIILKSRSLLTGDSRLHEWGSCRMSFDLENAATRWRRPSVIT